MWISKELKKELSEDEILLFDDAYPDGVGFVDTMKWIHADGCGEDTSTFVNEDCNTCDEVNENNGGNKNDGDSKDIAVCLSTQQDIGLIYKTTIPPQRQVLLCHGVRDGMVSIEGAAYLEAMIPNATLSKIIQGSHQGVIIFFPSEAKEALNRMSR